MNPTDGLNAGDQYLANLGQILFPKQDRLSLINAQVEPWLRGYSGDNPQGVLHRANVYRTALDLVVVVGHPEELRGFEFISNRNIRGVVGDDLAVEFARLLIPNYRQLGVSQKAVNKIGNLDTELIGLYGKRW